MRVKSYALFFLHPFGSRNETVHIRVFISVYSGKPELFHLKVQMLCHIEFPFRGRDFDVVFVIGSGVYPDVIQKSVGYCHLLSLIPYIR